MAKKKDNPEERKVAKRLMLATTPAVNLPDELSAATELLRKQRNDEQAPLVVTVKSIKMKDVNDEFTREYLITEQAKEAATIAIARLHELDIPTVVPSTFKSEMVKDEKQMAKIRDNLKMKKDRIENSEKAKKLRELKKMGKKIQQEVLQKRSKEKREFLQKVKTHNQSSSSKMFLDNL